MRMVRCRHALALAVAAVLLLVACGDDGESSAPAPPPTTTTTLSQAELDDQKAARVVLTAADVPGYTQDPPDPDDPDAGADEAAIACFNDDPLLLRLGEDDDPRGASSPDFSRGDTTTVSSAVTFAENEDQARASMNTMGASSFPGCFSNALREALREEDAATFANGSTPPACRRSPRETRRSASAARSAPG